MNTTQRSMGKQLGYWAGMSAFCAAAVLAGAAQAADFYKWTDANGTTHFTDKPPSGVEAEKLSLQPPAAPAALDASVGDDQPEGRRQPDEERCELERERLATLESSWEIRMRDDSGAMRVLSTEEVKQEIALSQAAVARYCQQAEEAAD